MSLIVILMMNVMNNFLKAKKVSSLIVCVNHALLGFCLRQSV